MAHNIETMAYAGEVPWHGLGVRVPADLTPEQMLDKAKLNWTVTKVPCTFMYKGDQMETGHQALVRESDGKMLDVITDEWNPLQNSEAFEFFNDFVQTGDMEMHTAGSLKGGQIVWALAKVKESFELFGGDAVDSYMLFSNPHMFGKSITVMFTPIRVVCNNTLTLALSKNNKTDKVVKVNHRRMFDAEEVKETLGIASQKLGQYKEAAQFLGSKRYTADSIVKYFNEVFPTMSSKEGKESRASQEALAVLNTQPGANFAEGSWWQAYNAVTFMTDHTLGRSNDTRLQSAWYGQNRQRKLTALEKAVEFAEAA